MSDPKPRALPFPPWLTGPVQDYFDRMRNPGFDGSALIGGRTPTNPLPNAAGPWWPDQIGQGIPSTDLDSSRAAQATTAFPTWQAGPTAVPLSLRASSQPSDVASASQNFSNAGSTDEADPDAKGNMIGENVPATGKQQGEPNDQLTAFRNLMANPTVEGRRNDVYLDSNKILTVGIGHKVLPTDNLKLGDVISDDRVNELFSQDGSNALKAAKAQAAQAGISDPDFITSLASVNFQLGAGWTRDFKKAWPKIVAGDYAGAAREVNRSSWAKQTPVRVRQFQHALLALPPKIVHQ